MLMRCQRLQPQSFNNMGRLHRPNISFKADGCAAAYLQR